VQGGFADITPDGLTILAERATAMENVELDGITAEIEHAQEALDGLEGEAALNAQQNLDGLNAIAASL